ncbi:MAG: hypothetical protein V1659_02190 [Candidatus Woesearchaeota archaeon]
MANSKVLAILATLSLFTLLLTLSSCNSSSSGGYKEKDYFKGYEGIDIEFMDNGPPREFIYDTRPAGARDNSFDIIMTIRNKGAAHGLGALFISGYDKRMLDIAGESDSYGSPSFSFGAEYDDGVEIGFTINIGGFFSGRFGGFSMGGGGGLTVGWHTPEGDNYGYSESRGPLLFEFEDMIDLGSISSDFIFKFFAPKLRELIAAWAPRAMFSLEGNTRNFPGGESEILYFPSYIRAIPDGVENYNPSFLAKACYAYVTVASPVMCIDPRPDSGSEKVCRVHNVALSGGQGAPVAITKVEQTSSTSKVIFTIYVEHKGDGTIYDYNSFHKCNPAIGGVKPTDLNVVYIRRIRFSANIQDGGYQPFFTCKPEANDGLSMGVIRLDDKGKGIIHCEYRFDEDYINYASNSAFEVPLYIELWYFYGEHITQKMNIKKI